MQYVIAVGVPCLVYWLVPKLAGDDARAKRWLVVAGLLFFMSFWIPSPLIEGQKTEFMTHFVGGGLFTGFVWLYIATVQGWLERAWWFGAAGLFALVSALGVLNELFEVSAYMLFGWPATVTDTSWDLVANTLGAALFYGVFLVVRAYVGSHRR